MQSLPLTAKRAAEVLIPATLVLVAALFSSLSLRVLDPPFAWIGVAWTAVVAMLLMRWKDRVVLRFLLLNVGAILLTLTSGEFVFRLWDGHTLTHCDGTPTHAHEFLAYAGRPNNAYSCVRSYGDGLVFDATYTTDEHGLRVSPPYDPAKSSGQVVFFGGSFVFGSGVDDDQTMPYRVGVITEGRYRVYNFGVSGYGASEMLAALEHGLVQGIVEDDGKPVYAIYWAIPGHVDRAVGISHLGDLGPRYSLNPNGDPVYDGLFGDESLLPRRVVLALGKSEIVDRLQTRWAKYKVRAHRQEFIRLYLSIIRSAQQRLERAYPGCELHVILWDRPPLSDSADIVSGLRGAGIPVHLVSEILPGFLPDPRSYELHERDPHPNTSAHDLIARFVVRNLLGTGTPKHHRGVASARCKPTDLVRVERRRNGGRSRGRT